MIYVCLCYLLSAHFAILVHETLWWGIAALLWRPRLSRPRLEAVSGWLLYTIYMYIYIISIIINLLSFIHYHYYYNIIIMIVIVIIIISFLPPA